MNHPGPPAPSRPAGRTSASGPEHGDHREIRLRPGSPAGHRDRVLIRRETARDADVIRAITTAAFAAGRRARPYPRPG